MLASSLGAGCSVRKMAVNMVGNALAGGGTTFASDDDPELVKSAVPFSLKLMESLLAESPTHQGLLFASASGFTQYTYAFIQQDADVIEDVDLSTALEMRARARKLYIRGRDYGLRGLEARHRGFMQELALSPEEAVEGADGKDVALLYWTAVAWGAAISVSKDDPDLIADLPQVQALIERALELDESFDFGAIHSFLITFEMSRPDGQGDRAQQSREHFERAVELSEGSLAGPYVALAEAVTVQQQNRQEFESLLGRALAIDPNTHPEFRLVNLVMQRRAQWLLSRADDLFL
jgi:predicted anti-sigma-YlaC factor YlaD